MSRRKAKEEKKNRIVVGKQAQDALRPLFAALNERIIGIRVALNVPPDWRAQPDQAGVPVAFVPPKQEE